MSDLKTKDESKRTPFDTPVSFSLPSLDEIPPSLRGQGPPVLQGGNAMDLFSTGGGSGGASPPSGDRPPQDVLLIQSPKEDPLQDETLNKRYFIHGLMGEGGMGKVYLAFDGTVSSWYALKVLNRQHVGTQDALNRFLREFRINETLTHENIVRTFYLGFDSDTDHWFFTMEPVPGENLYSILEKAKRTKSLPRIPIPTLMNYVEQIVDALQYSHKKNVIHRDLKPSNIMITPSGQVKILDFGIAKVLSNSTTMHTGYVGTPYYMSPEQLDGGSPVTPASDVYSLAMIIYEALTGTIAMGNAPPPSEGIEWLSSRVDSILFKALSHKTQDRFETPMALLQELRLALSNRLVVSMFRGDIQHTGIFGAETPDFSFEEVWRRDDLGSAVSASMVMSENLLFVPTVPDTIFALEASTGKTAWSYRSGAWNYSTPALGYGNLYFGNDKGELHALDAKKGESVWSKPFTAGGKIASSPLIMNGMVVFGCADRFIYALDCTTGEMKWWFEANGSIYSSPANSKGTLVFGCRAGYVYALDPQTGSLHWQQMLGGYIDSSPALVYDRVFVGSHDKTLSALDLFTGKICWQYTTEGIIPCSPAVSDGLVYFGSNDEHLYALDSASGSLRWKSDLGSQIDCSPILIKNRLITGANDGYLHLFEAQSGRLLQKEHYGGAIRTAPIFADGTLFFGTDSGMVWALK